LQIYSDADFANDLETRRSTTGTLMLVNEAPIDWQSRRQALIAQSTEEAEYIAVASTLQHGAYVIRMLQPLLPELAHNPKLLKTNRALIWSTH